MSLPSVVRAGSKKEERLDAADELLNAALVKLTKDDLIIAKAMLGLDEFERYGLQNRLATLGRPLTTVKDDMKRVTRELATQLSVLGHRTSSPSGTASSPRRDEAAETDYAPALMRTAYLNDLMRRASTLSFGDPAAWTVDRAENVGLVTLEQVWTPLRVADSWTRVGKVGTHETMAENDAGTPLHELFAATTDHLLILGDPGSGKSSSVAMLAMNAAQAAVADIDAPTPIWINLASVTGAVKQAAERPEAFLTSGVSEIASAIARGGDRAGSALARTLEKAMLERRALVLLDGLDEVKDHMLPAVRHAITQLVRQPQAAQVIVTCRKFDYRQSAPIRKVPIDRELELLPYSLPEMYTYVQRWYEAAFRIGRFTAVEATSLSEGLCNELQSPDLTEMGSLPLLLALLTLIHSEEARLPDSRAVVSDRAIKYMLADAAKWRTREAGASTVASGPILALATEVAYEAHLEEETPRDDQTDWITEQAVREAAASIARSIAEADRGGHSEVDAETLAKRLLNSHGLLLHTGDGTYRFSHRYFQEYLAGQHFAQGAHHPEATERGTSLHWREPFRLIASFAGQDGGNLFYIFTLIAALLDSSSLAAQQLGAEMLAEIGRQRIALRQFDHVLGPSAAHDRTHGLWDRARDLMAAQVESSELSLAERERSAAVLGYLGDSRLVDASGAPHEIPHVAVPVRGGSGRVGTARLSEDEMVGGWVGSIRDLSFESFRLGRYPVTNSQFAAFVGDNGYGDPANWEGEVGRGWVSGDANVLKLIREHWLNTVHEHHAKEIRDGEINVDLLEEEAQRRTAPRTTPYYWLDRRFNHPSQPVVGINWWEAAAYSVWATRRARNSGAITENEVIRLPTEFEWEHASRPTNDDRIFPWGDSWADERAHVSTNTLNMRQPAPVGIYLEPWPNGPFDLAGNVWEWTLSLFLPYDEEFDAARISHDSLDERVVRGSSWYNFALLAACGVRAVDRSYNLFYDVGFRVGIFGIPG